MQRFSVATMNREIAATAVLVPTPPINPCRERADHTFYDISFKALGQNWSMTSHCPVPGILVGLTNE
jgi:hypothetical protein